MALTVAQLVARLTADTSGFYRGMALANSSMIRTGGIVTRVAAGAGLAVAGMGILALRSAGNFQASMNIVEAVTGATTEQMKALHDEAIALGRDMKLPNVSAKDAADAMTELGKAGMSTKDILGAARGTLQLGVAANISFADSAQLVARSLTAFNLEGDQAIRIADLFTAAANKSTASATDIALGFQMASANFAMTGQSVEDLTTSLTIMANAGIVGSDAGTSLKTMMSRLYAPTKKAKDLMHELGIAVYDSSGHFKKMPQLIDTVTKSMKGKSEEERNAALYTLFGSDATRASFRVLMQGRDGWEKMRASITKGGEAQAFAEARTKGFNGAVQALFSAVETLAIELGEHMLPAAESITRAMARFVNSIDPDKIAAFFGFIADGLGAFVSFVKNTDAAQYAIVALIAGFAGFFIITSIIGMVTALTTAITAMGVAMLANPVVLVAAALVALGAALVLAYMKSEEFRAVVDNAFSWIRENVVPIIMDVVQTVREAWPEILEIARAVLSVLVAYWKLTWGNVYKFVKENWDKISAVINAVLSGILILVKGYLTYIQGVVNLVMGIIKGDWSRAWQGIKQIVDGLLGTIVRLIINALTKLIPAVLGLAIAIGKAILTGIQQGISNLADWLGGKVKAGVLAAVQAVAGWAVGAAAAIGHAIVDGILSGVTSLPGRLAGAVKGAAKNALDSAMGFLQVGSPSKLFADKVGKPIAEGIIVGFLYGANDLPKNISDKLKESLEAGKKVVEGYQEKFKEAFGEMVNDALEAFDKITEGFRTIGEKALAAFDLKQARLQAQKEMQELVKAVTDAQLALQMHAAQGVPQLAREEGESEAAYQARQAEETARWQEEQNALLKTYNDAQIALEEERNQRKIEKQRAALVTQAEKERTNYEERRAIQRRHLEKELNQLVEFLLKHPKMHQQTQNKIIKLLHSYGIAYHESGTTVGEEFARGLRDSMPVVVKAATDMARAVARILHAGSPTEEGPMSTLDHWWDSVAETLASSLNLAPIQQAATTVAGALQTGTGTGMALGTGTSTTGGPSVVVYQNVYGSVIAEQDLNDRIRQGIIVEDRRGRTIP